MAPAGKNLGYVADEAQALMETARDRAQIVLEATQDKAVVVLEVAEVKAKAALEVAQDKAEAAYEAAQAMVETTMARLRRQDLRQILNWQDPYTAGTKTLSK
jgi:hypothetical protein